MVGRLLQHHPHAAAAKTEDGYLPLHCVLGAGSSKGEIKASAEAIGMILAAHPQVRTAQPQGGPVDPLVSTWGVERRGELSPLGPGAGRFLAPGSGLGLVGTASARR